MFHNTVSRHSVAVLCNAEPLLQSFFAQARGLFGRVSAALECKAAYLPTPVDPQDHACVLLLVCLPTQMDPSLEAIATALPTLSNVTSADLLTCRPLNTWSASPFSVSVDLWRAGAFADGEVVLLAFAAGDELILCRRTHLYDEMESFQAGVQAQCASSGPDYKPWRIHCAADIKVAAGQMDIASDLAVVVDLYWVPELESPAAP